MNRAPMLTRSSNALYGALSASIIFSSFLSGWMKTARFRASGCTFPASPTSRGKPPALPRIDNQLGAAEKGELAAVFAVGHQGVPDLRGPPQVHGARLAVQRALRCGFQEVHLELDGGEVLRVPGQVRDAAVAGERVGEGDDRPGVQISVRREKHLAEPELASHQALGNFGEHESDQAGQVVLAEMIEAFDVESGPQRHGFSLRAMPAIICDRGRTGKFALGNRTSYTLIPMTTPNRLGKYEITEVLGRGAMGVVYKGFDPGIRRIVAIKTIRRELIEGERPAAAMLARFRNEAQAAGKLAHPGIVAVYDYGEDASVAYIAMEYVEGNSLREYLGRGTRFAERDAVSVMSQLLEGLAHAHERRVWHRDIKPANIIVMMNGRVKVADFGIARIEASDLTQTGAMLGSPGYMAPEQYAAAAIDHRADLFAAGVVFYQLVTGAKPFVGTSEQITYATCHTDALRPSLADPGKGWERYDPIIAKALAKRPEDRFQTAEAFRAAILAAHAAPAAPAVSEETIIAEVLRPAAAVDLSSVPSRPQSPAPRPLSAGPAAARPARRWAWEIGSAAAVVAAIFAAWQAGWLAPAQPSAEVQAQLAKARAEAEEAKRSAQAEAAVAAEAKRQLELERAAEAKSARARAETQTKRRAQTEATRRKEDAQLAAASKNR